MPTINEALRHATVALAHLPSPRLDAEVLLGHALGWPRSRLICERDSTLGAAERAVFDALVGARAEGRPVAQLRGAQEFWSLDLEISDAVLVPRAETELLVALTLARSPPHAAATIADLGTGSGAVALALAHERPRAFVLALDYAGGALAVAAANRQRLGISNMACVRGNWLAALAARRFDFIVANPPYVAQDDPALTGPGVRFEPAAALIAGADGLGDLRVIADTAARALNGEGWLLLEHGAAQGPAVRELLQLDFNEVTTARDLAGLERVTCGRRKACCDG